MKQYVFNRLRTTVENDPNGLGLDKEWVSLIMKAKEMGITITEIKEFINDFTTIRKSQ